MYNNLQNALITASNEEDIICGADYSGEEVFSGVFKVDFERTIFTSCRFSGCDFSGSSFINTNFTSCDFSNCRFSNCYFKNCVMYDCKGEGCDFSQSSFLSCALEKGSYCFGNFSGTLWKNSSILRAKLDKAFLSDCKLDKLIFEQVSLIRAEFFHTPLKGVDLSDCVIEGIIVSETFSELRGLKIDASQALDLALLLGVRF